ALSFLSNAATCWAILSARAAKALCFLEAALMRGEMRTVRAAFGTLMRFRTHFRPVDAPIVPTILSRNTSGAFNYDAVCVTNPRCELPGNRRHSPRSLLTLHKSCAP